MPLPFYRHQHLLYVSHVLLESLVNAHKILHRGTGMQDGGMVLTAYFRTYRGQGTFQQVPAHVHSYLPCLNYLSFTRFRQEVVHCDIEILAHGLLDLVYRDIVLLFPDEFRRNLPYRYLPKRQRLKPK